MSTETAADRSRIKAARARKAGRLAEGCRRYGIDSTTAARLDDEGRAALAGLMHVPAPSNNTWDQVVERLLDHEARHGDPLATAGGVAR